MKTKNNLSKGIAPLCFLATMLWNCAGNKHAMSDKNQNSSQGPSSSNQPTSSQEPVKEVSEALDKKCREASLEGISVDSLSLSDNELGRLSPQTLCKAFSALKETKVETLTLDGGNFSYKSDLPLDSKSEEKKRKEN